MKEAEKEREEINRQIDSATSIVTGKPIKEVRNERRKNERKRKELTKEIYSKVLSGQFDDVTLQQINDYINDVTPNNRYGRILSQRLPQEVGRKVEREKGIAAVDALFSRISESSVRKDEQTRQRTRREREEGKKELLTY